MAYDIIVRCNIKLHNYLSAISDHDSIAIHSLSIHQLQLLNG